VNRVHHLYCASRPWARRIESQILPWGLEGIELGDDVLEIGPGLGATTRVLVQRPIRLTAIELEHSSAERLRREFAPEVDVIEGDATAMPLPGDRFSAVTCFTMLHHVPSPELQDRVLAEACRVLRPGGTFAGTDSLGGSLMFKLLHIGDTFVRVAPETLPDRLSRAGFEDPQVETAGEGNHTSMRFRARKP
jgi:ubiquinone/menaquinone biosynthesis C-methylase UbiE